MLKNEVIIDKLYKRIKKIEHLKIKNLDVGKTYGEIMGINNILKRLNRGNKSN